MHDGNREHRSQFGEIMTIVITGAGAIGSTIARQYADRGIAVRILTRSGSGPEHPLVERLRVDVNDRDALLEAARDADVIHHCIHASAYVADVWRRELLAAEQVVLDVAAQVGALVVFPESLYAFDTSDAITETSPRSTNDGKPQIRRELLAARAAAPARTVSVVASDYFGPGAGANAHAGDRMLGPATSGGTVRPLGSADLPHSWTYVPDLAAAMITASTLPPQDDRILFAPTSAPRTQREIATDYANAAGRPEPKVRTLPSWVVRLGGRVHADTGGIAEMLYMFERPLVMDSTASEAELGLAPTPWDVAVKTTVEDYLS
jgi:nucleoside-diphosphate-sugar epimerase